MRMAVNEHNRAYDNNYQGKLQNHCEEGLNGDQVTSAFHSRVDNAPVSPAGTYFVKIPIKSLTGQVEEEHLHKLSLFLSVYGGLLLVIGVIAILFPIVFSLAVSLFVACLLVLGGILSFVQFILMCGAPGTSSFLLLGVLHLGIGLWIIIKPIDGGMLLIYVVSGWFAGHGILKLLTAYQVRSLTSWPAVMASGVLSFFFGLLVLFLSPRYGLVLLGIIFGVDLLASGLAMLLISCMAYFGKRAEESYRERLIYENQGYDASV